MRKMLVVSLAVSLGLVGSGALLAPPSQARTVWDVTPVSHRHDVTPSPRVVDLRVGRHPTYDRVVIDLQGKLPGYRVAYVSRLTYDGSGLPVPLTGQRFIAVSLRPAVAHTATRASTYAGPRLQQYSWPTLRGVAFTGDYEGVVSFGISTSRLAKFRVFTLTAPSRLVIDLHH